MKKTKFTINHYLDELDEAGRRFKKTEKGHRDQLYSSMQSAQHFIAECRESRALQSQFIRAVQQEKKEGRKRLKPFNLSLEAMARAMGASSRAARKLASKPAGVLELLHERGVDVRDTAATVKKEGLEKLYAKWCKRKKAAKAGAEEGSDGQNPSPPVVDNRANHNDKEVVIPLWMRLSERVQLLDQKPGAMLTVLVSRVSEDDGDLKVRRVIVVNNLADADDWRET
jgi:hypothetical protein